MSLRVLFVMLSRSCVLRQNLPALKPLSQAAAKKVDCAQTTARWTRITSVPQKIAKRDGLRSVSFMFAGCGLQIADCRLIYPESNNGGCIDALTQTRRQAKRPSSYSPRSGTLSKSHGIAFPRPHACGTKPRHWGCARFSSARRSGGASPLAILRD